MFTSLFQLEQKPVTVFSSDDVGAPILTKDAGSLKTLLKACLVTGYGDKTALGWNMLFESGDLLSAAFASTDPTASKFVLKINNSSATTAKISAYQSMTDVDTGLNAIVIDNIYDLHSSSWRLIGHSKAFILLLDAQYQYGKQSYPLLFGDLPREVKNITPVCVIWTGRTASYSPAGLQATLFNHKNGNTSTNISTDIKHAVCYPVRVNLGAGGGNVTTAVSRFDHKSELQATALYEPVFFTLSNSTWSFLPMLQCLSTQVSAVGNLGLLDSNAIKAVTGIYGAGDNNDCAVPIDWWYA